MSKCLGLKFVIPITSEYETYRVYEYGFEPEIRVWISEDITVSPTLGNFAPKFGRVRYKKK